MEQATFTSDDGTDLRQYRTLSPLAVIALVLGLLSPVALTHPLLWMVPIVGAAVAVAAIISIGVRNGEVSGGRIALIGLMLAMFFASWSMGQVVLRGYVLRSQARQFADHWLDLWQQGELEKAHQLTKSATEREPKEADLKAIYAQTGQLKTALEVFKGDTPRGWLKELHANGGNFEYVTTEFHAQESSYEDVVTILYRLSWEANGATVERPIRVVVERRVLDMVDLVDWQIREVDQP